ncbi:MAG: TlpA disulfide reductase family protein [Steroidobacteraceae bacterium]
MIHIPFLRRACRAAVLALALCSVTWLPLAGCSRSASGELQPGSYRAVVDVGGGRELPFGLDVAREEHGPVLYLINGDERVRVTEVKVEPGKASARFAGYENELSARVAGEELSGTITLAHADDRRLELPFRAKLGETWRFHADAPSDNADMAGRWDITFIDGSGKSTRAVLELQQQFGRVTGTVIGPADDQRYLAGEVRDEELRLSRFDGGALMLYEGKLDAQGRWVGNFWADRGGARKFVAVRNPDASIDAGAVATHLRDPEASFAFAFPDTQGRTVSSTDPALAGKVLLLTLAGSWCPNSHDEAALLVALERKYRDRGLAVVSLMFEQHADAARAVRAIERFRAAYAIPYPTPFAGQMDKTLAARVLPQLDGVRAYPTALFIDRSGKVRRIYTGFRGPATGVLHELMVRDFAQTIEQLLAEGPPAASAPAPEPAAIAPATAGPAPTEPG